MVDDLASIPTDAVARPATSRLESVFEPIGVDQLAASPGWQPLPLDRPLDVSAALVTDDGSLAADFVIHAVVSSPTKAVSAEGVQRAIRSVLGRANDWKFSRIAMPVLRGRCVAIGRGCRGPDCPRYSFGGKNSPVSD